MRNNMWMVRAGQKALFIDEFREKSAVAIGWSRLEDLSGISSQAEMYEAICQAWPEWPPGKLRLAASQVYRFAHEIKVGDRVISYDPQARAYLLGDVISEYQYRPDTVAGWGHIRKVDWKTEVDRDALSTPTKNSLGAISTLFRVPDEAAQEIEAVAAGERKAPVATPEASTDDIDLLEDIEERATEFIKDKISTLDWEEMQ